MRLPFADAIADVVIIVLVLELVDDWQQVLREARRVLRPGGWLMLSYNDRHERDQRGAAHERSTPPWLVHKKWAEILTDLGVDRRALPSAHRIDNQAIIRYLQELEALAQVTTLTTFREQPRSAREIVGYYHERIYTSQWHMPEDVHAEALRRLDRWLEESCPTPDERFSEHVPLKAILATWPAG